MRRSGLGLILLLVVAMLVAWLFMTQTKNLSGGASGGTAASSEQNNVVQEAQDAVDDINSRMNEYE